MDSASETPNTDSTPGQKPDPGQLAGGLSPHHVEETTDQQSPEKEDNEPSDAEKSHEPHNQRGHGYESDEEKEPTLYSRSSAKVWRLIYENPGDDMTKIREDANRRVHQSTWYTQDLEVRVRYLERKIDQLLKLDQDEQLKPLEPELPPATVYIAEVKRQTWTQWVAPPEFRPPPYTVVEVVVEKPQNVTSAAISEFFRRRLRNAACRLEPVEQQDVERVRLSSPHIHEFFRGVMGEAAPSNHSVLLRPFKPILTYFSDIYGYIEDIERRLAVQNVHKTFPEVGSGEASQVPVMPEYTGDPEALSEKSPGDREENSSDKLGEGNGKAHAGNSPIEGIQFGPEQEPQVSQEMLDHLGCLVNFIKNDLGADIARHEELRARKTDQVAFKDLWSLFAPGDMVFDTISKQASRVYNVHGGRPMLTRTLPRKPEKQSGANLPDAWIPEESDGGEDDTLTTFVVNSFYIDFDGEELGPMHQQTKIPPYDGDMMISNLPVVPLDIAALSDVDSAASEEVPLEQSLEIRGRKFWEFVNPEEVAHREYLGFSLGSDREHVDGQVIIDPGLYFELHTERKPKLALKSSNEADSREVMEWRTCNCPLCMGSLPPSDSRQGRNAHIYDDFQVDRHRTDMFKSDAENTKFLRRIRDLKTILDKDQLMLLPSKVHGYVLRSRKWLILDVDKISPITKRSQNFEDLILPSSHKTLVEGLVRTHSKSGKSTAAVKEGLPDHPSTSLVRGKGKGVIILLHGVPGVGKTSTAECVAEYTERPLFSITCGDIGETPGEVQQKLEMNFRLAHRWGCVMLLDEADVFLQARGQQDMRRNAVVSVFLRVLEYYSGILFLTTNKVGNFDEAFKSRIHISLYYAPLDIKQSKKIWRVNLKRISETHKDLEFDQEDIMGWAHDYMRECEDKGQRLWNGRQIYNACQTAVAIAQFKAKDGQAKMSEKHFDTIAEATRQFDEYLEQVHGGDDSAVAERNQYRYDTFKSIEDSESESRVRAKRKQRSQKHLRPPPVRSNRKTYRKKGSDKISEEEESERTASHVSDLSSEERKRRKQKRRDHDSESEDDIKRKGRSDGKKRPRERAR